MKRSIVNSQIKIPFFSDKTALIKHLNRKLINSVNSYFYASVTSTNGYSSYFALYLKQTYAAK